MKPVNQKCTKITAIARSFLFLVTVGIADGQTIGLFYDFSRPQNQFAAGDIKAALEEDWFTVDEMDLKKLNMRYKKGKIVISLQSDGNVTSLLEKAGGAGTTRLGEQAYALRTTTRSELTYWVLGGDDNGAMCGTRQIAEYINFNGFADAWNEEDSPYLLNRGVKFNIPMDDKAPTYFYDNQENAIQGGKQSV
jgi:hypothetical protein